LYLVFISIVLAFQLTTSLPQSECGGRTSIDLSQVAKGRTYISIVYAVFIGILSVVVGVGFIFFGTRLYKKLKGNRRGTEQKKLFLIASVCSVAFFLHCVFIFVLIGLDH